MATALVQLVLLLALFAGLVAFAGPVARWAGSRLARRRAVRHPVPAVRPLENVAADLRRLGRQVEFAPAGVPMARRRAVRAAYDDVLTEAAGILGVSTSLPELEEGRRRDVERLRVTASLRAAGLQVPV
ncbi:hypothetical protein [Blastococcus sp. LR1]|uniref:hypothetical protein n=1 Tax=Blastococcus sp. LR1 TaxID=2877000 RepID=UPI001CCC2958|nr:hypothetical protein [Blastococcus sp. LR1]MCA0144648.1 hypothetical protein [Blastococcus sp. LR1]